MVDAVGCSMIASCSRRTHREDETQMNENGVIESRKHTAKKMAHTSRERGRPVGWQLFTLGTCLLRGLCVPSLFSRCVHSNAHSVRGRPSGCIWRQRSGAAKIRVSRTTTVPELFLNCRLRSSRARGAQQVETLLLSIQSCTVPTASKQGLVQPAHAADRLQSVCTRRTVLPFPTLLRSALPSASSGIASIACSSRKEHRRMGSLDLTHRPT